MLIYIDLFILLNLIVNGIIIFLTGWVLGKKYNFTRYSIAILLSVTYSMVYLLCDFIWLSNLIVKFFMSMFIVWSAFKIHSFREFIRILGIFYMISFILGGAVYGYFFFESNSKDFFIKKYIHWEFILKGILLGCIVIVVFIKSILKEHLKKQNLYMLKISYNDKSVELMGLLDTGNRLYTIGGQNPVMIIDKYALQPLLNQNVNNFLEQNSAEMWITNVTQCHDKEWVKSLFFIPYKGIENSDVLLGFKPDSISVLSGVYKKLDHNFVIAICSKKLVENEEYRILLHSEVLNYL